MVVRSVGSHLHKQTNALVGVRPGEVCINLNNPTSSPVVKDAVSSVPSCSHLVSHPTLPLPC